MNPFLEWLSRIFQTWKFWLVVPPWDIGVRVRLGKTATALPPGFHLRIPFLDDITLVNTRLRFFTPPTITKASGQAGKTRTITVAVGFRVADPVKALCRYVDIAPAVGCFAQAALSNGVAPSTAHVLEALKGEFEPHGVAICFAYFTEDVEAKTYRILNAIGGGLYSGQSPLPPLGGGNSVY